MGISGLLPLLKSIHKSTTLKKFAGQTIGIDGYGWLHRGAVACAIELALDRPTTKYVDFAMGRVRMLLDFGIIPYVVFDGDNLPSKAGTNAERRKRREEAKAVGLSLFKAGKTTQAAQELQKATGVTPYMARLFIEELKKLDVQYIVAPYEADAQLAYLERKGIINGVLSEDSDLLVFGTKRLITKLNQYGECIEIERADFPLCKDISLAGWTDAMFRRMAILSGCDYLPNIDKMGLKTAYRFVRKYKDTEKTIRMIAFEGKFSVPQDYLESFKQAELTFIHHRVFCPIQQKMVFLSELERDMSEHDMPYLGNYVEPDVAIGVACGDLNPKTKEPMEVKTTAPARALFQPNRRQTLGTPSDLKKKSSIDSFFKPQRTPLQELDPNSLSPSPSQQRLLQRHRNASWEPRTVNSAPQLRRAATTATPADSGVDRRSFLARASTVSNYHPLKRQRLCSENADVSPSREVQHSPFFVSTAPAMSPLNLKKARNRKSKASFDVWSDDSVDDILLGLISDQEPAPPPPAPPATKDDREEAETSGTAVADIDTVPQSSPVQSSDESQGPVYSNNGTQTQLLRHESSNVSTGDHDHSFGVEQSSELFEDLLDYHVRRQNEKLTRTFLSQSPTRQAAALHGLGLPRKRSSSLLLSKETESLITQANEQKPTSSAQTPTKDQGALHNPTASKMLKTFIYQSPEKQRHALQSLPKIQSDVEKVEIARASLAEANRAQTPAGRRGAEQEATITTVLSAQIPIDNIQGSEDALVPNSEDEASSVEDESQRSRLNLRSFAFSE